MKKILFIDFNVSKWLCFAILFATQACGPEKSRPEELAPIDTVQTRKDSTPITDTVAAIQPDTFPKECSCKSAFFDYHTQFEVYFGKNGLSLKEGPTLNEDCEGCTEWGFDPDTLKYWEEENRCLNVKSLALVGFDTISSMFGIFKNVESLFIGGTYYRSKMVLYNIFPKLKHLIVEGAQLDVNIQNGWLKNLTTLKAFQADILGLKSFKQAPNLEEIDFGLASLNPFPEDIEVLHCLRKIETHYWGKDTVDLRKMDLAAMPCLKYAQFHSWWGKNMIGIPSGFEKRTDIKVVVFHDLLTKEEKQRLKDHRKFRKLNPKDFRPEELSY